MACQQTSRRGDGFTLIELLIVVIILASLVAVVVPQFSPLRDASAGSSVDYTSKIVQSAKDR